MKKTLNEYWLIWLSAIRCPKVVHLPGKTAGVSFIILWMLPVSGLILAISFALPPIKVIFLVAWGFATIVTIYYWVSFLVGASELNRRTCAKLVPEFHRRIIQLIRGTWLILTINTSFFIWIGYIFFQKIFSVTVYCLTFICVGTALLYLCKSTLMVEELPDFKKVIIGIFLYLIGIPLGFAMLLLASSGEYPSLVMVSDVILVIFSAFLIWRRFNNFAAMLISKAYETNPLIQFRQLGQEALETAPAMVPSVAGIEKINTNDDAHNHRLASSLAFGEKYILKPLTTLLLCLDEPRETPRNALCLNLLGLSNQTSGIANVVFSYFISFSCVIGLFRPIFDIIRLLIGIYFVSKIISWTAIQASDGFLIFSPLGLIPIFNLARYPTCVASTSKEQALMRLSPMLHSLSDLNQMLAQIILRHSFFIWLKWTGITLIAAVLLGTPATLLMMQLAVCCMGLPFLGTILVDYAADGQKQFAVARSWVALFIGLQLISVILLFSKAGDKTPHITLWLMGFILLNILLALAIISIRWSKMMASPISFPAGRMQA